MVREWLPLQALIALLLPLAFPAAGQARLERGSETRHPGLLLSSVELAQIREETQAGVGPKADALTELERRLGQSLKHRPRIPTLQSVRTPGNPYTTGPGRDGGVAEFLYGWGTEASNEARDCAVAFWLTGNSAYLDRAREILLGYADALNPLPQDYADNHQAVHYVSMPMLKFAWTYDLIAPYLSPERCEFVEDWLLQAALYIVEHDWTENRQSVVNWYNACVCAIGYVTGRDELVDWAISRLDGGFMAMVADDITPSGEMIKERERHGGGELRGLDYGLYNLEALATLAEMAAHNGLDLWGYTTDSRASLRGAALYYAPYVQHYIGRRVPEPDRYAGETVSEHKAALYELLSARYDDPELAAARHGATYDTHLLGDAMLLFRP